MGVVANIGYEMYPQQWTALVGAQVKVCFRYDAAHEILGTCIRADREDPGVKIFQLEDGRIILDTECQWSPVVPFIPSAEMESWRAEKRLQGWAV